MDPQVRPVFTRRSLLAKCRMAARVGAWLGQARLAGADWTVELPESQGLALRLRPRCCRLANPVRALRGLVAGARWRTGGRTLLPGGAKVDDLQPIHSVTRASLLLLVGLSLHSGKLASLDRTVAQCPPEPATRVAAGTSQPGHAPGKILTGMAGLHMIRLPLPVPKSRFLTADPVAFAQGLSSSAAARWVYNDAAVGANRRSRRASTGRTWRRWRDGLWRHWSIRAGQSGPRSHRVAHRPCRPADAAARPAQAGPATMANAGRRGSAKGGACWLGAREPAHPCRPRLARWSLSNRLAIICYPLVHRPDTWACH